MFLIKKSVYMALLLSSLEEKHFPGPTSATFRYMNSHPVARHVTIRDHVLFPNRIFKLLFNFSCI